MPYVLAICIISTPYFGRHIQLCALNTHQPKYGLNLVDILEGVFYLCMGIATQLHLYLTRYIYVVSIGNAGR